MFIQNYIKEKILRIAQQSKAASRRLSNLSTKIKNDSLQFMADILEERSGFILDANSKDIQQARENGLSSAFIDRLTLNNTRIMEMSKGLRDVAVLPDPVGEVVRMWRRPNGLQIGKIRTPIGVIGIIYESRPNVTVDAAALCIKSGNAVILRGGSEAINSNIAIANLLSDAGKTRGLPDNSIQLIDVIEREAVLEMLKLDTCIDLIIPRGGHSLIRTVVKNSTIPVIKHDKGLCHVYIDSEADLEMGERIAFNAKVQRPSVCNAMETLLVHKDIARRFLPPMIKKFKEAKVEIRGCSKTKAIVTDIENATDEDWDAEYLDLILSIKIVDGIDEAIEHITRHGSMLSEAIVTMNYKNAWRFLREVDAASVFVNASTRFTDGGQFGLGAEMGISTQKLHCRGPMGLEELTSIKYIIFGDGQIRE
ncbi:MAG: glutamate-5-semialdehyde dehydrogenase [Nitrospinae bacterium RIFCSPLOWO2_02_FULL_39_110]|nr:MAG: glutamate-5-semialdehyde dehydrogenase [Nitrospinae bacterium RIFCSPHIGHO2_02_39_11]OGW00305.1 MAG: glutamate-5-semialdehyde dehydrogenase [Nitrospinae bacterium RIFCSPHIGHO2_12_FULL_39_42]OGW01375.1 MAG: glutamate-5-semialdehyde dehydrogenase [Nitrospinae bacterium RIFCSPHIGHO2_02_FULL_39_82]OGW02814.1 MAG: glutamate-5-semialdehyde dehydrogenase [Nitrospinae bacterium RIFCSPLOWO2_02_39_17]OGW04294.1 MAG: glutamate-5-semialdehyde dehydrogenase [Nitrospinae bacterium RIFCSPLOWO2_02_FULL_